MKVLALECRGMLLLAPRVRKDVLESRFWLHACWIGGSRFSSLAMIRSSIVTAEGSRPGASSFSVTKIVGPHRRDPFPNMPNKDGLIPVYILGSEFEQT